MFECKYKLTLEDNLQCAKYIFKSQKRKKDTFVAVMLPILIVAMIGMLIFDIVKNKSIVWDIVLLVALVVMQATYLLMPLIMKQSQKKAFKSQKLDQMDYLHIKIDDKICVETLYKDEQEMAKSVHNLKLLTSYMEDETRIILVFNKIQFVMLKKDSLTGGVERLKSTLEKAMSKQTKKG